MKHLHHRIQLSPLFHGYDYDQLQRLLHDIRYRVADFHSGQMIAQEHASCSHLGIVLAGKAEVQKSFASGKVVSVSHLDAGEAFGEAMVFSHKTRYPASIIAAETPTSIMFIGHGQVRTLCRTDDTFFPRFAGLLSQKLLMLNRKVQLLSYPSVRQKVIAYLLDLYDRDEVQKVVIPVSRQTMAQQLGLPRPSVSREMIRLRDDGLIEFHRNVVELKDPNSLVDELLL